MIYKRGTIIKIRYLISTLMTYRQFTAAAARGTERVLGRPAAAGRTARTAQMVPDTRPVQVPGRWLKFLPGCTGYPWLLAMIIHIPGILIEDIEKNFVQLISKSLFLIGQATKETNFYMFLYKEQTV